MDGQQQPHASQVYCYRCTNGCIHLTYYNVSLVLQESDFFLLTEAMNALSKELTEDARAAIERTARSDSFLM